LADTASAKTDWLQFGFDPAHSGHNPFETEISAHGVGLHSLASLHALYHVALPSIVNSTPVLLTDVQTPLGIRDLLFLTTIDGRILARDAADGSAVWERQAAVPPGFVSMHGLSVTASAAIDPNRQFVYAWAFDGRVHKWAVGDGAEIATGGWPQLITLKPMVEKASSPLTIATAADGTTYLHVVTSGYYGDYGDYQGHLTTINLVTGQQTVFNALCTDQTVHFADGTPPDCGETRAGIWGRGGVPYDARTGRIYLSTGNGLFDGNVGGHHFGDSVLALGVDGRGQAGLPLDSYTPAEYQAMQDQDDDLGSLSLAILPDVAGSSVTHLGVQGGKDHWLRLLDLDDLSGQGGVGHVGGELQKIGANISEVPVPHPTVWTRPSDHTVWLAVSTSGFRVDVGPAGTPVLTQVWQGHGCLSTMAVVNDVLICAGSNPTALDAYSGEYLWFGESAGGNGYWQSPIVANGHIYFATDGGVSGTLSAYAVGADSIFANGFQSPVWPARR
jgi:hypothetical protein